MDQELLIIELISAKPKIIKMAKRTAKAETVKLLSWIVLSSLFFFGVASLVYRMMKETVHSIQAGQRLSDLYHVSWLIGGGLVFFLSLLLILSWVKYVRLTRHFDQWISQRADYFLHTSPVFHDDRYLYFEKTVRNRAFRIEKSDCQLLLHSLDNEPIYIGQRKSGFGLSSIHIFLQEPELKKVTSTHGYSIQPKVRIGALLAGICLIGLAGVVYYGKYGSPGMSSSRMNAMTHMSMPSTSSATAERTTSEGLLADPKQTVQFTTQQVNDLQLDKTAQNLYMTTDSGKTWTFVPIASDWLRFGDYTLTSGTVPEGFWMDKTYDVSADFSWFIYSSDNENIWLLSSRDNGKTWQKSLVSQHAHNVRYRKANFFDGSGVLVYSTDSGMSAETLHIYTTRDEGETWTNS
ncbi:MULTISPECIES: glycosyl hydrolase [unclassified Enterococcus]|uniref:WD40/YVTN/BNR-like repeat-containing protein n=1 Tax=unclassified Enterococcus TaxID=2608891 RepID=UPI001F14AFC9|nr:MULTISPECIES: glycosyl hydrolase [unclassified Enterococcus]